jgi:hypothetical protein
VPIHRRQVCAGRRRENLVVGGDTTPLSIMSCLELLTQHPEVYATLKKELSTPKKELSTPTF